MSQDFNRSRDEPQAPILDVMGPQNLEEMLNELAKHLVSLSKRLSAIIDALGDSQQDTQHLANALTHYNKTHSTSNEPKGN